MKYRIVPVLEDYIKEPKYSLQKKCLFFWVEVGRYYTVKNAECIINHMSEPTREFEI